MEDLDPKDAAEGASASEHERDDHGRFLVAEPEVAEVAEPEVLVAAEPEPEPEPAVEAKPKAKAKAKAEAEAEVSVSVSALVYRPIMGNSQSVAVMQARLSELGFAAARGDIRGWFYNNTRKAVSEWQAENKRDVTGAVSADDARVMFLGTKVVVRP